MNILNRYVTPSNESIATVIDKPLPELPSVNDSIVKKHETDMLMKIETDRVSAESLAVMIETLIRNNTATLESAQLINFAISDLYSKYDYKVNSNQVSIESQTGDIVEHHQLALNDINKFISLLKEK